MRQVTQRNTGRATAGIDGRVALTARARGPLVPATCGPTCPTGM
ncbi:reverse transcriptase N-terminal domain-containing protein [Dactylosporangium sp. McL0621]